MGTMLLAHGTPLNSCFEELNLKRPELILEIHKSYIEAGAGAIVTNTFGGNRPRLEGTLGKGKVTSPLLERINRAGVRIARKAAGNRPVFASIGPLGREAKKMGPEVMRRYFREQALALEKEKPSGFLVETMTSVGESEAAVVAVREISRRPIICLMTFPRGLDRAKGETLQVIAATLRAAGADVIGANCGSGPEEIDTILRSLSLVDAGPFCVRPSAGLPGSLLSPEEFASWGPRFKKLGCQWIGGCCGTTPAHIRALRATLFHCPNNMRR